jgi:Uma2 family endonuclease
MSRGNRPGRLTKRISEYLEAGVSMVWVVDSKNRRVAIYRPDEELPLILHQDQVLENLPELPGFRCAVAEFFL